MQEARPKWPHLLRHAFASRRTFGQHCLWYVCGWLVCVYRVVCLLFDVLFVAHADDEGCVLRTVSFAGSCGFVWCVDACARTPRPPRCPPAPNLFTSPGHLLIHVSL